MPFCFLLILTLIYLQNSWPEPFFGLSMAGSALLTWGGIAIWGTVAGRMVRRLCLRMSRDSSQGMELMRRFAARRRYFLYGLIAFYLLALYGFGWGWTADHSFTFLGQAFPGRKLLILGPFLVCLVVTWARFYEIDRAFYELVQKEGDPAFPGRWSYVGLQARQSLMLVLPPLILLLLEETLFFIFSGWGDDAFFRPLVAAGLLAGAFLTIPWIFRLILGLKPLPEGPLRDRLMAAAARVQFRCNDILFWNTRTTVANAMVTGSLPFLRYVVLTDRLVQELQPEEVEAVFGHEVGHVKHNHMLFYLAFMLGSVVVLGGAWKVVQELFPQTALLAFFRQNFPYLLEGLTALEFLTDLVLLLLMAFYIFAVFGFLSRRCERQADIFGCRTVSCQVFISALEKVARLNGINRERPGWLSSWQHATIAQRVEFLQHLEADPGLEQRFQRRVGLVKWGVALALLIVLGVVWTVLGTEQVWAILL